MKKTFILLIAMLSLAKGYSQNVGIGTSTPTTKLHIKGSADTSQLTIDANATQSNNHPLIRLRNAAGKDLLHIHSDDETNIFIGLSAGRNNNATSGGNYNTFIGRSSGYSNTIGFGNTANGEESLYKNTTGSKNTANGNVSLYNNTTGSYNTANGIYSLYNNTTGNDNTANGSSALTSNTTGNDNTASGVQSLSLNTTGNYNTAIGYRSLYFNTTGSYNTAIGLSSLYNNTTGYFNTANGVYSLYNNTTGSYNTANGYYSLFYNTTGSSNTAIGLSSLYSNTTGNNNTANGSVALYKNTTGSYNTANGFNSLYSNTTAYYNTALGYYAGGNYANGYNNVFLGALADVNGSSYYNVIAIGEGTICTASSQVTMGNSATGAYRAYANWSNISDGRFKKNIQENVPGLNFITQLRPVTYTLNATDLDAFLHKDIKQAAQPNDKQTGALNGSKTAPPPDDAAAKVVYNKALKEKEATVQTGFVAQEVEATAKKLGFNFSGVDAPKDANDVYGLRYSEFVVPLVKAVQEQQQMIEGLKTANEALKNESAIQKNSIADLQKQIDELKALIKK